MRTIVQGMKFTAVEEAVIGVYDTTTRDTLIESIRADIAYFEEVQKDTTAERQEIAEEMCEVAKSVLQKLESMSDEEFSAHEFSPADSNDDMEE